MYGIARVEKSEYDPRVQRKRRAHKLERAREDVAMFGNVRLYRFERGLLAFDRLIRRIAGHV